MHAIKFLFATVLIIAVSACSSVEVSSDYTKDYNFNQLQSFKWHLKPTDKASLDYLGGDIFDLRVRQYIEDNLTQKGMRSTGEHPSFFVSYSVLTEDRTDINSYSTGGGYPPWYNGYYSGFGMGLGMTSTQTTVTNYKQGTLIIDIIDPATNKLIWRGTADGRIAKHASPEKRREGLRKIVDKTLADFPPKSE